MNFLQSLTKKVAVPSSSVSAVPETRSVVQKKKKIVHSSNVIVKNGSYKGYYGSIYRSQAPRFELLIKESHYVYANEYGIHPIGSKILTEVGESVIKQRIPILYNIRNEQTGESMRYAEGHIRRIIGFNHNGLTKIGLLLGVENANGKTYYITRELNLNYEKNKNIEEILSSFQQELRNKKDFDLLLNSRARDIRDKKGKREEPEVSDEIIEELLEKLSSSLTLKDASKAHFTYVEEKDLSKPIVDLMVVVSEGPHFGNYGSLTHIIPEQYLTEYNKFVLVTQNNTKADNIKKRAEIGDTVTILRGTLKNKKGTIIGIFPENLTVFIDAAGKKINSVTVRENDQFKTRSLTKDDVFFMDIRLKNGNYFEVKSVLENGNIIGIEKGVDMIPREVSPTEIERYQSGFSFDGIETDTSVPTGSVDMELAEDVPTETDIEGIDVEEDENEELIEEDRENSETDSTNGEIESESANADDEMGANAEAETEGEKQKFVSSYKDVERTQFTAEKLSNEQQQIRQLIVSILEIYEMQEQDVKLYDLIKTIAGKIDEVKNMVNKVMEDYWKKSDEKYIIACFVLYEIIRLQNTYLINTTTEGDTLGNYVRKISSSRGKIFRNTDIKNSVFLTAGWSDSFTVNETLVKTLYKTKEFDNIYRIMIENCDSVLQKMTPPNMRIDITQKKESVETELIPLGFKKREKYEQRVLYSKDILSGNVPESATKIIWGPQFQDIIEKYKLTLQTAIEKAKNETTRDVYTYVLENLEQAPLAIRELSLNIKKTKRARDSRKQTELQKVFNSMLEQIRERDAEIKSEQKQREKESQKVLTELSTRRAEIDARNKMLRLNLFGETEEDLALEEEIEETSKPKRRRRLM